VNKVELKVIGGFIFLLFLSGCVTYKLEEAEVSFEDLVTDKLTYHSSETMEIKFIINSNSEMEGVKLSVSGIGNKLNKSKLVELEKGLNEISFTYQLPRCNSCGGINEGEYQITGEVSHGKVKGVKNILITIKQ
jgi:hypothetical protein